MSIAKLGYTCKYPKKIPSNNEAYLVGRNRTKSWVYLNPIVAEYKKEVSIALAKQNIVEHLTPFYERKIALKMDLSFIFREGFWERDVDNLVKATCDAFVNVSKLDDSLNIEVCSRKIINDVDDNEYIVIAVDIVDKIDSNFKWSSFVL